MSALIIILTAIVLFLAGYWFMGRLDRVLDSGTLHPYWDSEEERISAMNLSVQKKAS